MCVTANPARILGTRTYVHATSQVIDGRMRPVHISGYQNEATNRGQGPNCMFLNFAGSKLELVQGPEHTRHFMDDLTAGLEELEYVPQLRGGGFMSFGTRGITVESYGDYTVVLAQGPGNMLDALDKVEPNRRPPRTRQLDEMIDFYMSYYPDHSFVLACFDGKVKPQHPIVVRYVPNTPEVLTTPGLDGHDGKLPVIGAQVFRNFHVAFGIAGAHLSHQVRYSEPIYDRLWAPRSVAGFLDNRDDGPNGDYIVRFDDVLSGMTGRDLARVLLQP